MRKNNIKEMSWVNNKLNELKEIKQKNRVKYITLTAILSIINLATVVLAIIAIVMINEHSSGSAVILSSLSAGFIIILFFLHNLNIIYRGIMKDKQYKKGIDYIQHEVMVYNSKPETYKGKFREQLLIDNVEKHYKDAIYKNKKKKMSLFLRAFSGGANV